MKQAIKEAKYGIIPAGGLGTRFLPASAAVPKELFPVFDTPLVAFAMEEMRSVGVEKVFIIISPWKRPLFERYLQVKDELKERLLEQGKDSIYNKLEQMQQWPEIELITQERPQGLAQAVALCRSQIGDESFYILLPDEVMYMGERSFEKTSLEDLKNIYQETKCSCVGLYEVSREEVSNYGVAELGPQQNLKEGSKQGLSAEVKFWTLKKLVEKPQPEEAPSQYMLPGRYLLTSDFWTALEKDLKKLESLGRFEEVHMTDALDVLAGQGQLIGVHLNQERFDVGRPQGLLNLIQAYAAKKD